MVQFIEKLGLGRGGSKQIWLQNYFLFEWSNSARFRPKAYPAQSCSNRGGVQKNLVLRIFRASASLQGLAGVQSQAMFSDTQCGEIINAQILWHPNVV